ncbi:unnamed protein product [Caenorhabditis brenneri]
MSISVTIANQPQWSANPDIEMKLIMKRAYFKPGFIYTIDGLNPLVEYDIHLEVRQLDNYRYKLENGVYIPQQLLTESDHPMPAPRCARLPKFCHQEFVPGSEVGQVIDFSNVFFVKKGKSNSVEDKDCTIVLETVFKYEPCVVVVEKNGNTLRFPQPSQQFVTVSSRKRELVEVDDPVGQPVARRQRTRPIARVRSPVPVVSPPLLVQYPPVIYAPIPHYPAPMPYYNAPLDVPYCNQPYLPVLPPLAIYHPDPVQVAQPPPLDPVVEDPEVEQVENIPDVLDENVHFDGFESLFNDENMEDYLAGLEKD